MVYILPIRSVAWILNGEMISSGDYLMAEKKERLSVKNEEYENSYGDEVTVISIIR